MSPELLKELVGVIVRYLIPALVGTLAHYMTEEDRASLIAVLQRPEMLALYGSTLTMLAFGLRSWWQKTKFGLTAAAMASPATPAQIADTAKTQAPSIMTPSNEIPQLKSPN